MKRRTFIRNTAIASAAMSFLPMSACTSPVARETGLILYTVRDLMANDPLGTLDMVAGAGFNWLEAASYSDGKFYGMKPSIFRKETESRAMSLVSSHNALNYDNIDSVAEAAAEAGLKYLILPSLPPEWRTTVDDYKKAAEFLNIAGEKCRAMSMKVGFHNHSIEFMEIDGQVPYDILLNETEPELVTFELDLAWISAGGKDPVDYFNSYPGRFELWHIKDLSVDGKDATLGEGTIDFAPIFAMEERAGMLYFFIEQDNCVTHSPGESIRISRNYLIENVFQL